MPSDADYCAMAYGHGDRRPFVVEAVEREIEREMKESQENSKKLREFSPENCV